MKLKCHLLDLMKFWKGLLIAWIILDLGKLGTFSRWTPKGATSLDLSDEVLGTSNQGLLTVWITHRIDQRTLRIILDFRSKTYLMDPKQKV